MTHKRLYRSQSNKVFAGIIGGIGEYADVDPVLLRVVWVAITVFSGIIPGLLVYLVALFVVPSDTRRQGDYQHIVSVSEEPDSDKTA